MNDNAIISIVDQGIAIHVLLTRGGHPLSFGRCLFEAGTAGDGTGRQPGELAAALVATLFSADAQLKPYKQCVRLIGDAKAADPVAFSYEVKVVENLFHVKAVEHGKNGTKNGNGHGKVLFDGVVSGYFAALKMPPPEHWEWRWLVEVISVDQDIYHRMFSATEAQAGKLKALIGALVKAKELKDGSVVAAGAFETRYTVDNLIGQLTDLLGAGAVKRAAAAIAPKPSAQKPATALKPKPKSSGPGAKPKSAGGTGKTAK